MKKALVFLIALGLFGTANVFAGDIKITGKKVPLTVISDRAAYEAALTQSEDTVDPETGEPAEAPEVAKEVPLKRFDLLGIVDDSYAVITYNKGEDRGFVPLSQIQEELPVLDLNSVNSVSNWSTIHSGASGDNVLRLQQNLATLGYLDVVDGQYGPTTADAISHYRVDRGMESLYDADIFTFLMIADEVDGDQGTIEIKYPVEQKVEIKYASIYENLKNPEELEGYLDRVWHFTYDAFDGKGLIENSEEEELGSYTNTSRPIDTISISLKKAVRLTRNEAGEIEAVPSIQILSSGAYRPYVQSVLLRNGSTVLELNTFDSEGSIRGADVTEETYVELTPEAEKMLSDNETVIRLKGSSKNFDL
jgi:peptidoglycan hydrolase-like protein with peptidoglycan-binding domain